MSSSHFPQDEQHDLESLILTDETGRSLECYVEHSLEHGFYTYLLLQPMDLPIIILCWEETNEDVSEAVLVDDEEEIEEIFLDAKAVLAELDLTLKNTAFTLTASGELPPLEEEDILTLEVEEENMDVSPEELQFLASFYHLEQKHSLYTPLIPLMFFARSSPSGDLEIVSPDDEEIQPILEELLFDELE